MAPPYLNMSDIFKIYNNYEPSTIKIWEMVRSYDPIEFAKLLYILENVTKSNRRKSIALQMETINEFAEKRCRIHYNNHDYSTNNNNNNNNDNYNMNERSHGSNDGNTTATHIRNGMSTISSKPFDLIIKLSKIKTLRLEKCVEYYTVDNESNYIRRYMNRSTRNRIIPDKVNSLTINGSTMTTPAIPSTSNVATTESTNTLSLNQIENNLTSFNNSISTQPTISTLHRSRPTIFWNRAQFNSNCTIIETRTGARGDNDDDDDCEYNNNICIESRAKRARLDTNTVSTNNTLTQSQINSYSYSSAAASSSSSSSSLNLPRHNTNDVSITKLMNDLRHDGKILNDDNSSLYEQILNHNFGTKVYCELLSNIQYLLLNDNFQTERNAINSIQDNQSIVVSFLQFYKNIIFEQTIDNDPRNFHFLIIPKARQLPTTELDALRRDDPQHRDDTSTVYIHQPYFNGMHLIVFSSPTETKCYNRFGELFPNLAYTLRSKAPCTFEVIVLPIDKYNNARSWRYWPHRHKWIMYIVDVYRYKQNILLDIPFEERIKYAKYIENGNELRLIPEYMQTVDQIYRLYEQNRDIFDPIGGVYRRHRQHVLNNRRINGRRVCDSSTLDRHQNSYVLFNILYTFDLLNMDVLSVKNDRCNLEQMNMNFDMADYRVLCIAYGHCEKYIYLCRYDRACHQFIHAASMERHSIESDKLQYRPEKLYILNNKCLPMGVLYLRVYFDINYNVIGYDTKCTDSRFNLPYTNCLYNLR